MKTELLEKWIDSPLPRRRRNALDKLAIATSKGEYSYDNLFERAMKLANDENWSVRAVAIRTLVNISLRDQSKLKDVLDVLLEKIEKESHENVIETSLEGLTKLVENQKITLNKKNVDKIFKLLNHEKSNVRTATVKLILVLSKIDDDVRDKAMKTLIDHLDDAQNVTSEILNYFANIVGILDDPAKEKFLQEYLDKLVEYIREARHKSIQVRVSAIKLLNKLIELDMLSLNKETILLLKKYMRDEKIIVKKEALKSLKLVVKKDPKYVDELLFILARDVLNGNSKDRLKLHALRISKEILKDIPRDLLDKHDIPRLLDIIDKNTVPKNAIKSEIKNLAREILEVDLEFTYEKRVKKFRQ